VRRNRSHPFRKSLLCTRNRRFSALLNQRLESGVSGGSTALSMSHFGALQKFALTFEADSGPDWGVTRTLRPPSL
jgi:hypothetical protein